MSRKSDGLFKRLERLFRSGPIVKRKVKDIDTRVAIANTDSSAVSLMQKSTSTTYTAITSRAYNVAERLMRYNDFVEMEQTPEIASALDIYADETCAQDEKGRSLHIYSDNTKIKQLLEELFYDTLNVEFNLRPWSRNLLKFGDLFLYNDVHPDHGVINVVPIPVNEIERVEGFNKEDPLAVKFRWGGLMNRDLENWEITHMRLLGNDTFLPYGSSIVEPARRIWRQLILIEDAMLIYRIVRAPDRRVFYIDVGNLEPSEVPNYIEQQRAQLRTNPVIDRANGRVDMKYNPMSTEEDFFIPTRGSETGTRIDSLPGGQNTAAVEDVVYIQKKLFAALKIPRAYLGYEDGLCLHGDTKIPLLNGTTTTIKELADKFEDGSLKETWAYSTDLSGNVKPGRVIDAFKTKKVKKLFNITLDNGSVVKCTENHPFLCGNGEYKRADELIVGESLMSVKVDGGVDVITSKKIKNNHKIAHIGCELLDIEEDVYDITVEYYSNFLLDAGVVVHNSSKSTLAFEDVRFSRTIAVIQRTIISELNKLAVIHLFANGFDGEDLLDFTLRLSNPSTVAQQQKLEIFRSKFEIAGTAPQGLVSKNYLLKNVLMLNDQEIKQINNEIKTELINDNDLANIGTEDDSGDTGDSQELSLPEEELPTDMPKEGNELLTVSTKTKKESQKNDPVEVEKNFSIKMKKGDNPIKPNHLSKHLANRKRRRTHGPATTNIPDFKSMLSADNKALSDIYDYEWLSGFAKSSSGQVINPLGEGIENELDGLSEVIKPVLTRDMIKTMELAAQRWGWSANNGPIQNNLIHENVNSNEFEIDFDELNNDDEE